MFRSIISKNVQSARIARSKIVRGYVCKTNSPYVEEFDEFVQKCKEEYKLARAKTLQMQKNILQELRSQLEFCVKQNKVLKYTSILKNLKIYET